MDQGQQIGNYAILGNLCTGRMGEVYLAEETRLNRHLVIKVLPLKLATDEERLKRIAGKSEDAFTCFSEAHEKRKAQIPVIKYVMNHDSLRSDPCYTASM